MGDERAPGAGWLRSPDVQIITAIVVAVLLALGAWRCARSLQRAGAGPDATGVAAPPGGAPAAAPPAARSSLFDQQVVDELVQKLSAVPAGSPAWIAASADDADALARAQQLATILARAGWNVHPLVRTPQRNRPGYFVFAADEEPPPYVTALAKALEEAGVKPTFAVGYRAYYDEARSRPGFVGFPFAPDQTFLLIVGRAS